MEEEATSILDAIANYAEALNAIASLIVGHRAILVESGINAVVVDQMCYNVHAHFLGFYGEGDEEEVSLFYTYEDDEGTEEDG